LFEQYVILVFKNHEAFFAFFYREKDRAFQNLFATKIQNGIICLLVTELILLAFIRKPNLIP